MAFFVFPPCLTSSHPFGVSLSTGTLLTLGSLPTFGRCPLGTLQPHSSFDPWVIINHWVVHVSNWLSSFSNRVRFSFPCPTGATSISSAFIGAATVKYTTLNGLARDTSALHGTCSPFDYAITDLLSAALEHTCNAFSP